MGLLHYDRECLSERVYDGEGKLIDQSYCCSGFSIYYPGVCDSPAYDRHPDETFRGRNAEQIRFQKGDIVEVYRGNEVKLAIVVGTPLTTEWVWERNQAVKDKKALDELPYDETDDSYTVIDGPGYEYHDHIPSLYVFAPPYHVPLYLQRRFKGYLEKAEKKQKEEEEKDRIFRQAHDCSFSNKEQIEKSEKCGCFFCCEIFSPSEITDYLPDEPPTAECPFCYTDSVIGDASGFPITKDFLKKMKKRWFYGVFSMFSSIFLPYLIEAVSVMKTDIKISFTAKAQSKLPKISNAPLVCSLSARQRGLLSFICYFVRR